MFDNATEVSNSAKSFFNVMIICKTFTVLIRNKKKKKTKGYIQEEKRNDFILQERNILKFKRKSQFHNRFA